MKNFLFLITFFVFSYCYASEPLSRVLTSPIEENIEIGTDQIAMQTADFTEIPKEITSHAYATQDTIFERVITLGHICTTKSQVNVYFNPGPDSRQTKKGHGDLFDWMFIYDYGRLADALSSNLEDIFERNDFIKTRFIENKAVFNQKYNMQWNHLFDKRMCAYSEHSTRNWNEYVSLEYFHEHFEEVKSKIEYLRERFISAKTQKTLYIISHPQNGPNLETLIQVRDALTHIREGNRNFCLLFVPNIQTYDGAENIIIRPAKKLREGWDGGNPARWREILGEFHFIPNIWE